MCCYFSSNCIPKEERYIMQQLTKSSNKYGKNYVIYLKVVNRKYQNIYDKKTKKYKSKCFETNTYKAY